MDPCTSDSRFEDRRRELVGLLPRLRRFARSLVRDPARADDLVQAACERALGRFDQVQEGTRIDSWLYRIVYTQWVDRLRRWRVRSAHLEAAAGECSQGDQTADRNSLRLAKAVDLRRAIDELPADHRAAVLLVCVEGHTYAEAAQILAVPAGTVASRVARAREALACRLRPAAPKLVALNGHGRTEGRK